MDFRNQNPMRLRFATRTGIETERFNSDVRGSISGSGAIVDKLNFTQSINQLETDTKIIERALKDVCDPLSEQSEDSSQQTSRNSDKSSFKKSEFV